MQRIYALGMLLIACTAAFGQTANLLTPGTHILYAENFAGPDISTKVNACIVAVNARDGGGVCDATALGGTTVQTLTSEIVLQSTFPAVFNSYSFNNMVGLKLPTSMV